MSMPKGKKIARGYATVAEEDGANYRTIADKMTAQGHPMNHASARNHVLRAMRKFAEGMNDRFDTNLSESALDELSRNPEFQSLVSDLIQLQ